MKVVHISVTPLAGSPIRIVHALNAYTSIEARLINLDANAYGARTFPEDLLWHDQRDLCEALIRDADILHFHHWFDFGSINNPFGFDFLSALKPGAKYLMHWHSNPMAIAELTGQPVDVIVNAKIPQMVVAQFHESYYPNAFPVPLIVEVDEPPMTRIQREIPVVFFSPSRGRHAYADRWETKGRPEVIGMLDALKAEHILDYKLVEDVPFALCQRLRSECDIVIDDLVTGAFHTTALEGLALGKPTFSYLDARTQMVLSHLTGVTDCPIVNVRYTEAQDVLRQLAQNTSLRTDLGLMSRAWMVEHYHEKKMILWYQKGYNLLLESGGLSNPRYQDFRSSKLWLYTTVPDLIWAARRDREMTMIRRWKDRLQPRAIMRRIVHDVPGLRSLFRKIKKFIHQYKTP